MTPTTHSKSTVFPLLIAGVISLVTLGQTFAAQNLEPATGTNAAAKPLDPSLIDVPDVQGLPRVLLIGDSISMGYTLPVRKMLQGVANVHRPTENCGPTKRGLDHLDMWLAGGHWDVIHFNFGLHDLKYLDATGKYVPPDQGKQVAPPEQYGKQLRELTLRLKATGAKVIFATTTPVPEETLGRVRGDEKRYNEVAKAVMTELGVPIDDLCAYVVEEQRKMPPRPASDFPPPRKGIKPRPGEIQIPLNVHFTPEGYDRLAVQVTESIKKQLPPSTK